MPLLRTWIRSFRQTYFFQLKLALTDRKRRRMSHTTFIGITGSSTKSTTSAIVRQILLRGHKVAFNDQNNGLSAIARTIRKAPFDADFAVLEIAAGSGTSVDKVARLARPDVAIVTMIELEHYTEFRTKEAIANEKGHLVESLPHDGVAFLNADDEHVMSMADRTSARVVTFGRNEGADYRAKRIEFDMQHGLCMSVEGRGRTLDLSSPLFGKHFYLPVLAAVACAMELGVPDDEIFRAVESYGGMINRCGVLPAVNGPVFVCDTQKAPFHSITLPMDTLAGIVAPRKTIVIGQIADYRGNPASKYSEAIAHAGLVADRVFTVGPTSHKGKARFAREGVVFARFTSLEELTAHLHMTAIQDEIILLKSAQNVHLERLAIDFVAPVHCWVEVCGQKGSCFSCGLYSIARDDQPKSRLQRRRLRARLDDGQAVWRDGSQFSNYTPQSSDQQPPHT